MSLLPVSESLDEQDDEDGADQQHANAKTNETRKMIATDGGGEEDEENGDEGNKGNGERRNTEGALRWRKAVRKSQAVMTITRPKSSFGGGGLPLDVDRFTKVTRNACGNERIKPMTIIVCNVYVEILMLMSK